MIKGLYEAHLPVSNLEISIAFYESLGLKLYKKDETVAFFWIIEGQSWLGLWEGSEYQTKYHPSLRHIAFQVDLHDLEHAMEWLKEKGIQARKDFGMEPIEPIVFPNQAHASVYFDDPDGNSLELIARLPFELDRTDKMYLSEWKDITKKTERHIPMKLTNEQDIIQLVQKDPWMMDILQTVKQLHLPDWWVCAGFVRSKIWDTLHRFEERTPLPDVDVVYFDAENIDESEEKKYEKQLLNMSPNVPWSVKNEARMHIINNMPPFSSSVDAISKFPETATALGLKLNEQDEIVLAAPWGVQDVINLELRPTPCYEETKEYAHMYEERVLTKKWQEKWSKVKVFYPLNAIYINTN